MCECVVGVMCVCVDVGGVGVCGCHDDAVSVGVVGLIVGVVVRVYMCVCVY